MIKYSLEYGKNQCIFLELMVLFTKMYQMF